MCSRILSIKIVCILLATFAYGVDSVDVPKRLLGVGFGGGAYTYSEPGVMKISGKVYGIDAYYSHFNTGLWDVYHKINFAYFSGNLNYTGSECSAVNPLDCSPVNASSKDFYWFFEYHYKPFVLNENGFVLNADIGTGFRYLDNQVNWKSAYEREQNYSYFFFGVDAQYFFSSKFSLYANVIYRRLLRGWNISHMTDLGYDNNLEFTQYDGIGVMLDAGIKREFYSYILLLSFFIDYWEIPDSTKATLRKGGATTGSVYVEPYNTTKVFGLRCRLEYNWF
ncbi:hypothetical protein [Helicobacter sp. 10-6591]|uniref:hypothetical protein n=1 Tax=Helicobacter sp. 10-6591 TaxID=2004998 RepID=UPI000DCB65DA|nr:hypothetical protein [Helicobacter sp. 10-6591]RAX55847.1 hypothetical protein CCY97_02820 [Helicobacter sp. 10-6591]